MNLTVSPQIRVLALAGLIAVLGLAMSVLLLSRNSASGDDNAAPEVASPKAAPAPARPVAPSKPVQRPARPVKSQVSPAVRAALKAGFPPKVARAFASNRVVVVELYSADAAVDRLALAEARAGASAAGVGFVAVDVSGPNEAATRALATKLGVREAPTLLVLTRPGQVSARINGFSDHETVAQAAANAAAGRNAS